MSVMTRRNWALRLSIILNVCVLLYVCVHFGSWQEDGTNWDTAAAVPLVQDNILGSESIQINSSLKTAQEARATKVTGSEEKKHVDTSTTGSAGGTKGVDATKFVGKDEHGLEGQESRPLVQPSISLKDAVGCNDKSLEPRKAQRGDYWVLYNYVPMTMSVSCWETITYTTHGDYTFLDNLEPLLERWKAPVSIAMHAPGNDFQPTLDSIKYLRNCGSPLVSQLVTFHLYFSSKHVPKVVPPSEKVIDEIYNCSLGAPWANPQYTSKMYKNEKKLLYPVNVGRNVARESAVTHYLLASDIELYPSPELPSKFLEMIRRRDQPTLFKPNPKVFVLSIFEVDEKSLPPINKTALSKMLKSGTAIPFHKKLCSSCHNVPKSKEWQEAPETEGLHVFHVGKRTGPFVHWEPIFIGTNSDPWYDERLSWEGKSDKMTQGYELCVLDYDFLILDNAFLVHRPGIKIFKKDQRREILTAKTNVLISKIIVPELKVMYGVRKGCAV
ncbi:beta-1,4-glucuronyltransferase 1 [Fopius arisanus]|uniref:B3gnt1_0 protein n=1 Tax=Fopius arisanus TaxID=64838 RepID=A0A0C9RM78_9HYME|nr:PREDICTED: beta-1,4-glucuronyltransferase 1 [Fopius arisanus]XP_011301456.1 PREDICTED: beta-1,4-glucuronyltransferase 1 [Fopius arisanus]XP_011301465.1 PREDICTED: beta-1,4-glucuronyltransferase 1 [Fopius arisanus]